LILHITTKKDWENALVIGEYIAPSLNTDGFIHCSGLDQTVDTANLFFKGQNGLILLCIEEKNLHSECRYENPVGVAGEQHDPRDNNVFPHIYGPINLSAVVKVIDFPTDEDGLFSFPKDLIDLFH
jgi:uncharacterized protein (DUF952 family)